ncbi:uncharacterized protein LOC116387799 [Anarrhichthys ocellatus]|uniref:uncharacterized protein LOC116387799 n=1 Tax=Anarrhichthys ocellatus TaxID=433405 RepID=UPI0012EE48AD|nr:uncharacterized protein LOC116387799 [Anarrhichthys ocellatus]
MHLLGILVLMFCDLSLSVPVPVDTIIVQVQQRGVVGAQQVVEQVLLNGFSLTGKSQEVDSIIQMMSADALLPTLIAFNQTSVMRNHTVLRSRECILEGSQLHWADRVFYDGKVYLNLDNTDTWTAHVPEALAFKAMWDQEEQRTKTEGTHLQERCIKLMRELMLSEEQSVPGFSLPRLLMAILTLVAFAGFVTISLLLTKKQGLRHPGGVIGSIIHYPKDMTETAADIKGGGYSTLAESC